jgi:hypothetical protein
MGKAKKLAEGLKRIGDKVVKKRMTTKERNEMSKPFKKMLSEGQKSKKGMSKKDFDAAVKKGMAEDARIAKVKAENMAAATGPIKPVKKTADGSVQKMKRGSSAGGVGNFVKGAARKAYQLKTAPLQVASRLAQRIAPDSLVAGGLRKAASPFKKGGLAIKGQGKAFKNSKR